MKSYFPQRWLPYVLMAPTLIVAVFFIYYPALVTFDQSLYRTAFLGLRRTYIGLGNFQHIFITPHYLHSILISFVFAAIVLLGSMAFGLGIALLANSQVRGTRIYRAALIWPYALSPAISGAIWLFLFNPSIGAINWLLSFVGLHPDWNTDGVLAFVMVGAAAIWNQLGYNIVFFLAGLQNLPGELIEAARIDGAGAFRILRDIKLPLLSPITLFLVLTNTVYAFVNTFGLIDVMTKGGPVDATDTLMYNLYRDGFQNYHTGLAAAQSILLFVVVVVITVLQLRLSGRWVTYGD